MVKGCKGLFANLISAIYICNPKVLADTINNIVTPAPPVPVFSKKDCGSILSFFVDKI